MILLTGATGFIGSHTWIELMTSGMEVIGIDNFSNSNPNVCKRIQQIIGKEINFKKGDVCDSLFLESIFQEYPIHAVIHFAALKAVGASVEKPLDYYSNNVMGIINLVDTCLRHQCHQFVFSSSATVYGDPLSVPVNETHPIQPSNPYGKTKWMGEVILQDVVKSQPEFHVATLRYFNPIGAHSSGLIGEHPNGIPNNLMPYLTKVAIGELDKLFIFGGDWPTPDGTGVRDYIHVTDLARGHIAALHYLDAHQQSLTVNLGTGKGTSVLDLIQAFEQVSSIKIPYQIIDRRAGDISTCYGDPLLAEKLMGWKSMYDLKQMCQDSWRWQKMST